MHKRVVQTFRGFREDVVDFLMVFLSFFANKNSYLRFRTLKIYETYRTRSHPRPTTS